MMPSGNEMRQHPEKALKFWAAKEAARKISGNCSRCGKPSGSKYPHGHCERCKEYMRDYKRVKGIHFRKIEVDQHLLERLQWNLMVLQEKDKEHEKKINKLDFKVSYLRGVGQRKYNQGYSKGVYAEQKRWSQMPREYDAWGQPLDYRDKVQMGMLRKA